MARAPEDICNKSQDELAEIVAHQDSIIERLLDECEKSLEYVKLFGYCVDIIGKVCSHCRRIHELEEAIALVKGEDNAAME